MCSVVTPKETELAILVKKKDIEEGAKKLLAKGAGAIIATLGSKGCLPVDSRGILSVPSYKIEAADTTAAVDCWILLRKTLKPTGHKGIKIISFTGVKNGNTP